MDERTRIEQLNDLAEAAQSLALHDDPVLQEAMPRIAAILQDALWLIDVGERAT